MMTVVGERGKATMVAVVASDLHASPRTMEMIRCSSRALYALCTPCVQIVEPSTHFNKHIYIYIGQELSVCLCVYFSLRVGRRITARRSTPFLRSQFVLLRMNEARAMAKVSNCDWSANRIRLTIALHPQYIRDPIYTVHYAPVDFFILYVLL